jgi:hypothetical protein
MYGLGTPQGRFASPTFLFTLLLGVERGHAVIAFMMSVLGMEGVYRYVRTRTEFALGPVLVAPLFALSGFFPTSFFNGWLQFYGFQLLPWALYGVQRAARGEAIGFCITAGSFAFMVGFGGTWALLLAALFAGLELVRQLLERARTWRTFLRITAGVALAGLFSLTLSMFRLLPVVETVLSAPRVMAGAPANDVAALGLALLSPAEPRHGNLGVEGYVFFPAFVLLLAPLSLLRLRALPAFIFGGLCVWAATGYEYGSSPFVWLRELPVFSGMRYPERLLVIAELYAVELLAGGLDLLMVWTLRSRPWRALLAGFLLSSGALLAGIGYVALGDNHAVVSRGMRLSPPPIDIGNEFKQARGNRWLAGYYGPLGRGSLSCMEGYEVPQSEKLAGNLPHEEFLADPAAGRVERRRWSPNRIELEVTLTKATRLVVNQNWHPGWRANSGRVLSEQGRIAVELPSGRHALVLKFLPRSALAGILATLGAVVGLGLLVRRERRGRVLDTPRAFGQSIGIALIPVAVLGAALLLIREPPLPAPVLKNANGSLVVLDELPRGVQPIGAGFALPVELLAVRLPEQPDAVGNVHFELFWHVRDTIPRSVGVFVHLEGPDGRLYNADHEVIGGSVFFRNAPQQVILRDAFAVNVAPRPGQWNLYVGLWHASGDGSAVPVAGAGTASVFRSRLHVGRFELRARASAETGNR